MSKRMIFTILAALVLLGASFEARAQSASAPPPAASGSATVQQPAAELPPPEPFFLKFESIEGSFGGKVVTGAPYSADAITETTQVLADGNRIAQKTTGRVYRDSQGRTRREQTLGAIGPWGAPADLPPMTIINDTVAGVGYFLDPRTKIAMKHPEGLTGDLNHTQMELFGSTRSKAEGNVFFYRKNSEPRKTEASGRVSNQVSLGAETIEGIEAEGTRETETIAAGAIGNEQPIQIVTERWYSPELQTVVMTKHSDPRFGDSVYKLTNISRQEPAPALFEVPPDYAIKDGPARMRILRKLGDK